MNPVLAKVLKKGAQEAVKKAIKYIKDDQKRSYALEEPVEFLLEDADERGFMGSFPGFTTADGTLEYIPVDADHCIIKCNPFPASKRLWNGPDIIGDHDYAAMAASLVHDLWWVHADEIAAAWGVDRQTVLHIGNIVLHEVWGYFDPRSFLRRCGYAACEFARPWYHRLKRLLGLAPAMVALALSAGCQFSPDEHWRVLEVSGTNAILRAMQSSTAAAGAKPGDGGACIPTGMAAAGDFPTSAQANGGQKGESADAVDFAALSWDYGGFRGGNATLVAGCEIGSLKISSSGMSYKWQKGGCEQLGASSRTAADCICALFVKDKDGQWRGGKFDWISTSRTTRSFENIKGEYHGWPSDAIETAAAYAFVITSKDGKRRSNVITCGR